MGNFFSLEIGKRAIMTSQTALTITGHNIANTNTPGYSRQIGNMVTTSPYHAPSLTGANRVGQLGTGVDIDQILRARDVVTDRQIRYESQYGGYWSELESTFAKLEEIANEPSNNGIRSVVDKFWEAWQDLTAHPESEAVRAVLSERGSAVADTFQHTYKQLFELREDLNAAVRIKVDEVNSIAIQISELNLKITSIKNSGKNPNDLEDKRDLLLDRLSQIVDIDYKHDERDMVNVRIGGRDLIQGTDVNMLDTIRDNEGMHMVVWAVDQTRTRISSGEIGAYLDARGRTNFSSEREPSQFKEIVPNMIAELNAIAKTIITKTNEIHRAGYSLNNQTASPDNANFFNMPSVAEDQFEDWAKFISVNLMIISDPKNIAAASNPTWTAGVQSNFGDGKNALKIAQLKHDMNLENPKIETDDIAVTADADISLSIMYGGKKYNIAITGATYSDEAQRAAAIENAINSNPVLVNAGITVTANGDKIEIASTDVNFRGVTALTINNTSYGDFQNLMIHSVTVDDYWRSVVADLGVDRQEAKRMDENQVLILAELTNKKESMSGVQIDEEGTNIIKFQNAYNAAARLITTVDEMLDVLINRTGVVGR